MIEEFIRFVLEPEPEAKAPKKARSFSEDFGEAPARELRGIASVLGEGSGVAGEERPREIGAVPQGGFRPNGPEALGGFFSERPLAGAERVVFEAPLGQELCAVVGAPPGVAGEEAAMCGERRAGGSWPRGPVARGVFRTQSVPSCEMVRTAEEPPRLELEAVRFAEPGVAGERAAKEAGVTSPRSAVAEAVVLEGDLSRMARKPRRRRRRGKRVKVAST